MGVQILSFKGDAVFQWNPQLVPYHLKGGGGGVQISHGKIPLSSIYYYISLKIYNTY